jgi:hypothetical protein
VYECESEVSNNKEKKKADKESGNQKERRITFGSEAKREKGKRKKHDEARSEMAAVIDERTRTRRRSQSIDSKQ